MVFEILTSSLALAIILLLPLSWRWGIKMRIALPSAMIIGCFTGIIVSMINALPLELNILTRILLEILLISLTTFLSIMYRFYRDPNRFPLEKEKVILSPADGRIIYVNKVEKGSSLVSTKGYRRFRLDDIMSTGLLVDATYLIGINMNLLNVHVNRSPIKGKTIFHNHVKGHFLSLRRQESEITNERAAIIIDNGAFKVGVIQIASRLVRRIVSYVKEGDDVDIGQRIGAILFGSQVDLVIPELDNLEIEVFPGDEVLAGISVIARYG